MVAAVVGAIFGRSERSRVPLPRGESLSRPRSRCPHCETPIRPYDNIPVLSWLALRGDAAPARAIPVRYPLVEADRTALRSRGGRQRSRRGRAARARARAAAGADHTDRPRPQDHPEPPDADRRRDRAAPRGLHRSGALPEHLIAGVAAGEFFLIALLAYPSGMGMGDVKLAAVLGLFLGRAVGSCDLHRAGLRHAGRSAHHRPQGHARGPQDRGALRPVPRPRRGRRPVRGRRDDRLVPQDVRVVRGRLKDPALPIPQTT